MNIDGIVLNRISTDSPTFTSFTGSTNFNTLINKPTLVSGSGQIDVRSTIGIATLATTASFNAYTSSTDIKIRTLEIATGSLDVRIDSIETVTASLLIRTSALEATSASLNSFTSSANIRLDSIEGHTGSYATTSSALLLNQNTPQTISGSLNISNAVIATNYTGSTDFNTLINKPTLVSGSGQVNISQTIGYSTLTTTASFTAYTSSTDIKINRLESYTSSYATTGSNDFKASQKITGSLNVTTSVIATNFTGSTDFNTLVNKPTLVSGSAQINASQLFRSYVTASTTYQATATDYTIDCTAGSFTVYLPTAVGIIGRIYNIKDSGAGTITVAASGSQLIDATNTKSLGQWDNLTVQSTNVNWIIL